MGVFGAIGKAMKAPVKAVNKVVKPMGAAIGKAPGMGAVAGAMGKAPGLGGMMGQVGQKMGLGPTRPPSPVPPTTPTSMNPMNQMNQPQGPSSQPGPMIQPDNMGMQQEPSQALQGMSSLYGGGGGGGGNPQLAEVSQMYGGGNPMPQVARDDMIRQAGEGALGAQQAMGIGPSPQVAPSNPMQSNPMQRRPMGRQMGRRQFAPD